MQSVDEIDNCESQITQAMDTLKSTLAKKKEDIKKSEAEAAAAKRKQSARLYAMEEVLAVDALRAKIPTADEVAANILIESQIQNKNEDIHTHARKLVELARAYEEMKINYCKLGYILIFCAVYIVALIWQKSTASSFAIESRFENEMSNSTLQRI